jgi:hypothetical protein
MRDLINTTFRSLRLWDPVSVTLGPGPQSVTHCLMATNTSGPSHRWAIHHFEIRPKDASGAYVHIPVDIDDLFFGVYPELPPIDGGDAPIPSTTLIAPPADPVPPAGDPLPEPASEPSDWPLRIGFGLAGLILGAGSLFAFKKD